MDRDDADVMEQLVVPTSLPIGQFTPIRCCLCGKGLFDRRFIFLEGSVCRTCFNALTAQARVCWHVCQTKNASD